MYTLPYSLYLLSPEILVLVLNDAHPLLPIDTAFPPLHHLFTPDSTIPSVYSCTYILSSVHLSFPFIKPLYYLSTQTQSKPAIAPTTTMADHNEDDLTATKTEGFKVGEKKSVQEYAELGTPSLPFPVHPQLTSIQTKTTNP